MDNVGGFAAQYARAREIQADTLVEEIIDISDDGTNDWMDRQSSSEKGAEVSNGWLLNGEHVARSRLRVDSRKWFASKVLPKRYGDKLTTEHGVTDQLADLMKEVDGRGKLVVQSGAKGREDE